MWEEQRLICMVEKKIPFTCSEIEISCSNWKVLLYIATAFDSIAWLICDIFGMEHLKKKNILGPRNPLATAWA